MKKIRIFTLITIVVLAGGGVYFAMTRPASDIVLTGIVTTDEVIVSSQMQGRLEKLLVGEGDSVSNQELLALIEPQAQLADIAFFSSSQQQTTADLDQVRADAAQFQADYLQAEANLNQANADAENARLNFARIGQLYTNNVESVQAFDQARTACDSASARVESARAQVGSARARVDSSQARIASVTKQMAATAAQTQKANVYLDYTRIYAPTDGIVDTRVALPGEVVNPGQAIVTLINEDDLWVRADVEETYIEQIHRGDTMTVRFPSGATREGTVFYRSVDADFATQRDVSRTKRDIRTFEIRLRCDNRDRSLAVGMTAYVTLPLSRR
ncbi:MAG TPA: efflux RND transporter periplasmic adaptor subunit [Candidatus Angelobacter sp.]|nr:efflux RND transporter periplasmic adaptor subunit [Candidatus Angelobacter sp.]